MKIALLIWLGLNAFLCAVAALTNEDRAKILISFFIFTCHLVFFVLLLILGVK